MSRKIKTLNPKLVLRIQEILEDNKQISTNKLYEKLVKENLVDFSQPTFCKLYKKDNPLFLKNTNKQCTMFENEEFNSSVKKSSSLNKPKKDTPSKSSSSTSKEKPSLTDADKIKTMEEDIKIILKRTDALKSDLKNITSMLVEIKNDASNNEINAIHAMAKDFIEYFKSKLL